MKTIQQGINVILKVDNKIVGGQQNVTLNRSSTSIDITNKIDADWKQSLSGIKTWSLTCSGIYIIDSESYSLLENAFMENKDIDVELQLSNSTYNGKAIITDFPISSGFNGQCKYSIRLLGNGELK